ncbi:MAG TPA: Yip1 family protein [Thermoanaerobaculia bacterium]
MAELRNAHAGGHAEVTSEIQSVPPQAPAVVEETKGPFQRIIGALFAPDQTFRDIARRPDIIVPLVLILAISTLTSFLVAPRLQFDSVREQITRSNPHMAAEDVDRAMRFTSAISKVSTYAAPFLTLALFAIVAGVLLIAFRLFGGEGNFKQALSVVLYAWLPRVIYGIILTIVVLAKGSVDVGAIPMVVRSNLSFLVDLKAQPVLFSLLSSLDVFTIWTIVLLIIGFAFVSGMTRARSAAIIVTLWAFALIIKLGIAALGASRMKAAS